MLKPVGMTREVLFWFLSVCLLMTRANKGGQGVLSSEAADPDVASSSNQYPVPDASEGPPAGSLPSHSGSKSGLPPGHLMPLGSHRPSEGYIDSLDGFPNPREFFHKYVRGSRPVLFKGAAQDLPAYRLWTDEYLSQQYGAKRVEVEVGKKENRSGGARAMTMSDFIRLYQKRNIYMVQDVLNEMKGDLILPRPLQCGGFQNSLTMGVIWFSSGGTKSVLHNDDVDNINCILDGSKSLTLIDQVYKAKVEADHFVENSSYSLMDVEKVDMYKFPQLQEVPWWQARMEKGDCLFIPIRWYHTVASSNERNLAVNLWFSHLLWFNNSDCVDCCHGNPSLDKFQLENPEEQLRGVVFAPFERYEEIELEDAVKEFEHLFPPAVIQEFFEMADLNKDHLLTWTEIYTLDIMNLVRHFPEVADVDIDEDIDAMPAHDEL